MKQITSLLAAFILVFACAGTLAAQPDSNKDDSPVMAIVEQVNINEADAETLAAALDRVGLKRAQAIVEWRTANGKFKSADQLLEIKGIGAATLEKNRNRILL